MPGVTNSIALPAKFCVSRITCEGVLTVEKPALLKEVQAGHLKLDLV